jgi:hypothetical protein
LLASNDGVHFHTFTTIAGISQISDLTANNAWLLFDPLVSVRYYRLQYIVTGGTLSSEENWLGLGPAS